jgi:hypothetical protein
MTHTSIDDYDPLREASEEDDAPDPFDVWLANRPFEELNRRMKPENQANARQLRIEQLRLEIQSVEFTVESANEQLAARRDELANLLSRRSGEAALPSSTFAEIPR